MRSMTEGVCSGTAPTTPRLRVADMPFGFGVIPAASLRLPMLFLLKSPHICSLLNPNLSPIFRVVSPLSLRSKISFSYCLICLYSLGIKIAPLWQLL